MPPGHGLTGQAAGLRTRCPWREAKLSALPQKSKQVDGASWTGNIGAGSQDVGSPLRQGAINLWSQSHLNLVDCGKIPCGDRLCLLRSYQRRGVVCFRSYRAGNLCWLLSLLYTFSESWSAVFESGEAYNRLFSSHSASLNTVLRHIALYCCNARVHILLAIP